MSSSNINYSQISKNVTVHGITPSIRDRREAATYINQGYRVTDQHGFDLTIETRGDGTHRVVRGEDPLGSYNDRERIRTEGRARGTDAAGRPIGLPERVPTDYEAGK